MIVDRRLVDEVKKINTMTLHLGSFVLSNSKRIMNNFIHAINGIYTNYFHYEDIDSMDSMYIEKKHLDKLDKAGLVGTILLQGKNDYKDGGIFDGLFLAPKKIYCLTMNNFGIVDENKTCKEFIIVSENLDRKVHFKIVEGDKLFAKVPLS